MPEPNNNSNNSGAGDQSGSGGDGSQGKGGSTTQNNQGGGDQNNSGGSQSNVDLKALPADQLAQVLENPALWETPRMKELLASSKELKALKDKQDTDTEEKLKQDKKFEELAQKKDQENSELRTQMETMTVNQSLTSLLIKENVVDLDGALKLIDRANISVKDGVVSGTEDAITALKKDKAYLFSNSNGGNQNLGTASNAGNQNQSSGTMKFKRSQLQGPEGTKFYQEHKAEIDEAYSKGLVEDDVTPR